MSILWISDDVRQAQRQLLIWGAGVLVFGAVQIFRKKTPVQQRKESIAIAAMVVFLILLGSFNLQHQASQTRELLSAVVEVLDVTPAKPYHFTEGLAPFYEKKEQMWGFIDTEGNVAVEARYFDIESFSEGLAAVRQGDYFGYIDREGTEILPFRYLVASDFSDGVAAVQLEEGRWVLIDKTGAPLEGFDGSIANGVDGYHALQYHEGLAVFRHLPQEGERERYGYLDKTGQWAIPPRYGYTHGFSDGYAAVTTMEGSQRYIDPTGAQAFPGLEFESCRSFEEGVAFARLADGADVILDTNGQIVYEIPKELGTPQWLSEGLVSFQAPRGGKYGWIDTQGNVVIPAILDYPGMFCDGVGWARCAGEDVYFRHPLKDGGGGLFPVARSYSQLQIHRGDRPLFAGNDGFFICCCWA